MAFSDVFKRNRTTFGSGIPQSYTSLQGKPPGQPSDATMPKPQTNPGFQFQQRSLASLYDKKQSDATQWLNQQPTSVAQQPGAAPGTTPLGAWKLSQAMQQPQAAAKPVVRYDPNQAPQEAPQGLGSENLGQGVENYVEGQWLPAPEPQDGSQRADIERRRNLLAEGYTPEQVEMIMSGSPEQLQGINAENLGNGAAAIAAQGGGPDGQRQTMYDSARAEWAASGANQTESFSSYLARTNPRLSQWAASRGLAAALEQQQGGAGENVGVSADNYVEGRFKPEPAPQPTATLGTQDETGATVDTSAGRGKEQLLEKRLENLTGGGASTSPVGVSPNTVTEMSQDEKWQAYLDNAQQTARSAVEAAQMEVARKYDAQRRRLRMTGGRGFVGGRQMDMAALDRQQQMDMAQATKDVWNTYLKETLGQTYDEFENRRVQERWQQEYELDEKQLQGAGLIDEDGNLLKWSVDENGQLVQDENGDPIDIAIENQGAAEVARQLGIDESTLVSSGLIDENGDPVRYTVNPDGTVTAVYKGDPGYEDAVSLSVAQTNAEAEQRKKQLDWNNAMQIGDFLLDAAPEVAAAFMGNLIAPLFESLGLEPDQFISAMIGATTFDLASELKERNPDWTDEQIWEKVWEITSNMEGDWNTSGLTDDEKAKYMGNWTALDSGTGEGGTEGATYTMPDDAANKLMFSGGTLALDEFNEDGVRQLLTMVETQLPNWDLNTGEGRAAATDAIYNTISKWNRYKKGKWWLDSQTIDEDAVRAEAGRILDILFPPRTTEE